MFDSYFQLGYVVGFHGLKGELKIKFDCDDPYSYEEMESVFIDINGKPVPFFIDWIQIQNNGKALLKLEEINSRDEATDLKGKPLYLPLDLLPELEENQFYFHQVIGYSVYDQGMLVGEIKDYYSETNTELFSVVNEQGTEILIPVIDEFITKVNHSEKKLEFQLPDGFLEVYLNDAN